MQWGRRLYISFDGRIHNFWIDSWRSFVLMSFELLCMLFLLQGGMVNPSMVPLTLLVFINTTFSNDHIQPKISQHTCLKQRYRLQWGDRFSICYTFCSTHSSQLFTFSWLCPLTVSVMLIRILSKWAAIDPDNIYIFMLFDRLTHIWLFCTISTTR